MNKNEKILKVKDILKITDGHLLQGDKETICGEFSYDTREMKKDDAYIGIKADTIDGSVYWKMAFENGANIVIINPIDIDKQDLEKWQDKTIIIVENTLIALQKIATYKRKIYGNDLKVVAITGSVGKTSTKDMIANVIAQKYKTLKTMGNYNNHIGLPLTLLRLKDEEVAVIEMGMNHFGEINLLTNIAKPDLAIITNIGTSHIGNLGSRENILKAKLEILDGMDKKEIIVNKDNDLLEKWKQEIENNTILEKGNQINFEKSENTKDLANEENVKIHSFGIENHGDVWAENIRLEENYSYFTCHVSKNIENKKTDEEIFEVKVPVGGIHFVYNALCAVLVGKILGLENHLIKQGIESFSLTKKRMEVTTLKNGVTLINDAYNASFESIKAAISYLEGYKDKRKIAVLGDIFELGDFSEEMHRKVGKEVAKSNIDVLLCSGENSKWIVEEAKKEVKDIEDKKNGKMSYTKLQDIQYFEDKQNILQYLEKYAKSGDVILVKASNRMKFFELCNNYIEFLK